MLAFSLIGGIKQLSTNVILVNPNYSRSLGLQVLATLLMGIMSQNKAKDFFVSFVGLVLDHTFIASVFAFLCLRFVLICAFGSAGFN